MEPCGGMTMVAQNRFLMHITLGRKSTLSFQSELVLSAEREQRRSLWGILLIIAKNVQVNVPMEILKI